MKFHFCQIYFFYGFKLCLIKHLIDQKIKLIIVYIKTFSSHPISLKYFELIIIIIIVKVNTFFKLYRYLQITKFYE